MLTWKSLIPSLVLLMTTSAAQAAPFAYIANYATDNVTVVNTVTNTLVTTVPVGSLPVAVAVKPDGSRVYVTNAGSASVSVLDTLTNTVIATVATGSDIATPEGVAVSPNNARGREYRGQYRCRPRCSQ